MLEVPSSSNGSVTSSAPEVDSTISCETTVFSPEQEAIAPDSNKSNRLNATPSLSINPSGARIGLGMLGATPKGRGSGFFKPKAFSRIDFSRYRPRDQVTSSAPDSFERT